MAADVDFDDVQDECSSASGRSSEEHSDYKREDSDYGIADEPIVSEGTTETFQINVDKSGNAEHLLQDAHNLYFSHMPRVVGTGFRFQVGELAYAKWRGELNLVVIHFASQKLVTTPGDAVDYSSDDDDEEDESSAEDSQDENAHPPPKALTSDSDGRKKDDSSHNHVIDQGMEDADESNSGDDDLDTSDSQDDSNSSPRDTNEDIFHDSCSNQLYSEVNAMRPLPLRCDETEPHVLEEKQAKKAKNNSISKRYFIPIYFVTFPGYKKRCAKAFRFWVKEKDLIKYKAVKHGKQRKSMPEIDTNKESQKPEMEPAWTKRNIEDINEYVYNVSYNTYEEDLAARLYNIGDAKVPWSVPLALQNVVAKQQAEIMKKRKDGKIDYLSADVRNGFSIPPLTERLSAYSIIQNFKYVLILMTTLIRRPGESNTNAKAKFDTELLPSRIGRHAEVEDISIPSLRLMDHLESAVGSGITASKFQAIYVNNIYWLDLYLKWMDTCFLDSCCYNEKEHEFISVLQHSYRRPLSRILGFEHLARLFCFNTMYNVFLRLMYSGGCRFMEYLPITQLLIHYMTFVATDYMHSQCYTVSSMHSDNFSFPQRRGKN